MCAFFLHGACVYGKACAFAHNPNELKDSPDLTKTRLCQTYAETGSCTDPECRFAHGDDELRLVNFKTSMCFWHEKGRCRNGDNCRFAHGNSELQETKVDPAASCQQEEVNAGTSMSASTSSGGEGSPGCSSRSSSPDMQPPVSPGRLSVPAEQISPGPMRVRLPPGLDRSLGGLLPAVLTVAHPGCPPPGLGPLDQDLGPTGIMSDARGLQANLETLNQMIAAFSQSAAELEAKLAVDSSLAVDAPARTPLRTSAQPFQMERSPLTLHTSARPFKMAESTKSFVAPGALPVQEPLF